MVTLFAFVVLFVLPCPPWSLKGIVAGRAQCQNNLKQIFNALDERHIPLDANDTDPILTLLDELNLKCPEGTDVHGKAATYFIQPVNGLCVITEDPGNHPARTRFMAGAVDRERFGIDAGGKTFQVR